MSLSLRNQVVAVTMSALLSQLPSFAFAETLKAVSEPLPLIPTQQLVNEMSRAEAEQKVASELQRNDVRELLQKNGISADEASSRLASLSDQELKDFAGQIDQARAGGDILVAVLLVVLIIFLVKRI